MQKSLKQLAVVARRKYDASESHIVARWVGTLRESIKRTNYFLWDLVCPPNPVFPKFMI